MFATPAHLSFNAPQSLLERQLIIDFLAEKGYSQEDLPSLPPDLAKELMTAACRYASLKLAEIEARSRFRQNIKFED